MYESIHDIYDSYYITKRKEKKYLAKNKNKERKNFLKYKQEKKINRNHGVKKESGKINKKQKIREEKIDKLNDEIRRKESRKIIKRNKIIAAIYKLNDHNILNNYKSFGIPRNILIKIIGYMDNITKIYFSETCWYLYALTRCNFIEDSSRAFELRNLYGTNFYNRRIYQIRESIYKTTKDSNISKMIYPVWSKSSTLCYNCGTFCNRDCDKSILEDYNNNCLDYDKFSVHCCTNCKSINYLCDCDCWLNER